MPRSPPASRPRRAATPPGDCSTSTGSTRRPATEEENVKGVLTKVRTGEVDAGLVYVSDATAAGDDVDVVPVKHAAEVVNVDPVALVTGSENVAAARDWVELVTGDQGQKVLESHGFGPRP